MRFIDTHCHFDDSSFATDRESVWTQAKASGVSDLVIPAITAASWPALTKLCQLNEGFHAAYGLHPIYLAEHKPEHIALLEQYLSEKPCVAVGECGLDFFLDDLADEPQVELFLAQLKLAKRFDLPLIIHARRSVDVVISLLRRVGGLRGVVHSFAGSEQQAAHLIKLGFCLGIGGTVTYERAQRLRRVVATLPAEALLLETDAPDQPDSQWRGQRNDPTRLRVVAEVVAALRADSVEAIAALSTQNAQRLFGIA